MSLGVFWYGYIISSTSKWIVNKFNNYPSEPFYSIIMENI